MSRLAPVIYGNGNRPKAHVILVAGYDAGRHRIVSGTANSFPIAPQAANGFG